jgi:hypothetical protein
MLRRKQEKAQRRTRQDKGRKAKERLSETPLAMLDVNR